MVSQVSNLGMTMKDTMEEFFGDGIVLYVDYNAI